MKKFFTIFFVILGVIFFLILLALTYFVVVDPYNIKPFIFGDNDSRVEVLDNNSTKNSDSTAPAPAGVDIEEAIPVQKSNLSPAQEKALDTIGINPEAVPQSFTPTQLKCFEVVLGTTRVEEIRNGDTPSLKEFYDAKACI